MTHPRQPAAAGATAFRVVVMVKYPVAGRVKTRLALRIGSTRAAELQRAFVLDLAERLRAAELEPLWAVWPPDAPFHALLPGARLVPQRGGDLGERMAHVAAEVCAGEGCAVVLLGSDVPHLDVAVVHAAAAALGGGEEVVLGPAADGGYYLLGLRRFRAEVFRGIDWGGRRVCAETQARCATLGLEPLLLPATFDVDDIADLRRLAALVEAGAVHLPHTADVLARTPLS